MEASRSTAHRSEIGWIVFVGTLCVVAGAFNAIVGIAALLDDNYFHPDRLLFGQLGMWGAFAIVMGAGQILIGLGLLTGSLFAQIAGLMWAGLNACLHLLMIGAYPAWSIIIMAIDGIVIYGLTVYGGGEAELPSG